MNKTLGVLVVMPLQDRPALVECLQACRAEVLTASCCEEAEQVLNSAGPVDLVFVPLRLQDGGWRKVLIHAMKNGHNPQAVVCVDKPNGGWVDVYERGAMGLLIKPYGREKIQKLLARAAKSRISVIGPEEAMS